MESKWEYIEAPSTKGLASTNSVVAAYTFSSHCDAEFYLETGTADTAKPLKKGQIERDGIIYEQMHNNLFSFAFTVNRSMNGLVTNFQTVASIPTNESIDEDDEEYIDKTPVVSLWYLIFDYFAGLVLDFYVQKYRPFQYKSLANLRDPFFGTCITGWQDASLGHTFFW
jgi:hypothetical protein